MRAPRCKGVETGARTLYRAQDPLRIWGFQAWTPARPVGSFPQAALRFYGGGLAVAAAGAAAVTAGGALQVQGGGAGGAAGGAGGGKE